MSTSTLKEYQDLQQKAVDRNASDDAFLLTKEIRNEVPTHLLQEIIWSTLPPPGVCLNSPSSCGCNAAGCLGPY